MKIKTEPHFGLPVCL